MRANSRPGIGVSAETPPPHPDAAMRSTITLAQSEAARQTSPILRIGNYEILGEIARGGMGVVYKARQQGVNRIVALKMTLAGQFAGVEERRRFCAEAEAAGQLDHPHIVPIHEVGQHDGQPFFSMGYVEGPSLKGMLSDGPLPPHRAAELMKAISEAVQHAHKKGVIHRDLKPSNILIDGEGQPWITDFGLAKQVAADSSLTATGQILGTPSFMPPEQAMGKVEQIGPRSDVYSLGAMLYNLLTGRPPFQAARVVDTLMQVIEQEPVAPRHLNSLVPVELETICLKCLQKDAKRRYASAAELGDEFGRFLRNELIHARPVGNFERAWRWCRRNPVVAGLTAAAALLLIAVAAVSTFAYVREKNSIAERDQLNLENDRKRVGSLVDAVLTAPPDAVPYAIENLRSLRELALPLLRERLADETKPRSQRLHAAFALAAFGQIETGTLVESIAMASDGECRNLVTALSGSRDAAIPLIQKRLAAADATKDATTRARVAIVALHLSDARPAIDVCRLAEDPVPRRIFEETLSTWNAGLRELGEQVEMAGDVTLRSAVCLAVGRMAPERLADEERRSATEFLSASYRRSPDTGTHGAAHWALRQWKLERPALGEASQPGKGRDWYVNSAGLTMLRLPAGTFHMGNASAKSVEVKLMQAFYLADREVSVGQFQQFMADPQTPASEKPDKWEGAYQPVSPTEAQPVQQVNWYDALLFCNWLSRREGRAVCYERTGEKDQIGSLEYDAWRPIPDADGYRLPTEAEWEYACRAGTTTDFSCGNDEEVLRRYAVFHAYTAAPCGSRLPNGWGLFDLHGNVEEWCQDTYRELHPRNPNWASYRIYRGGSWQSAGGFCRSALTVGDQASHRTNLVGFRVASIRLSQ